MIQIRLWNSCYNNCSFCSIKSKTKEILSIDDKLTRFKKMSSIKDDTIGIIGGEFFEGQLRRVEKEWLDLIKNLKCDKLFISANLINNQYLLNETINQRPNDILICTSYDSVGRFKNLESKKIWLDRVNSLPNVFCTIIPTQDMIFDEFIDNIKCGINLCEPHLGIDWYNSVNKNNYHENLLFDNTLFNLPKRNDMLKWLKKHPRIVMLMKNYKTTHFNTILGFDKNNEFYTESNNRFHDNNYMADCGHPYFSRCYADSDKCLICDLEEL